MGRELTRAVAESDDEITHVVSRDNLGADMGMLSGVGENGIALQSTFDGIEDADVAVDFSLPSASVSFFEYAKANRLRVVSGTTGLDEAGLRALDELSTVAPAVWAPNFSQGVALLAHVAEVAAKASPDFDIEIVEMHHRHKRDSPSGTARFLAERVSAARGLSAANWIHGREGEVGARPSNELGVLSMRGGSVIGDHTIVFAGPGERLELTHRADERAVFAHGALRAARWLMGQSSGRYSMKDVMGLTS
ncbi:MAG: 4-hydroxy-tetrahydrodipicolinate reductase [Polyangiales bacterium]|jgi:4-hydroxy-tetrahydrodipicolinate reductase